MEVLGVILAVLGVVLTVYFGRGAQRRRKGADVVMWLDRYDEWAFVVENRGPKEAQSILITPLQTPRGTVTVRNISEGLKIPILAAEGMYRIAALRELLSATYPAIFEVRWTDPNGKEQRREFPFYAG